MPNLGEPWDVATPDNRFAYIPAAYGPDLVQAFERNAKGGLVPLTGKHSCVSDDGTSPAGPCVDGRGMFNVERAVLSKNKRFIYTNAYQEPSPIAVLNRNLKTGKLSQRAGKAACMSADGSSKDGPNTCRDGRALDGGYAGILAPNGRTLYYAEYNSDALTLFRVSKKTGAFSQLPGKDGCVSADGSSEDGARHLRQGARDRGRVSGGARLEGSRRLRVGVQRERRRPAPRSPLTPRRHPATLPAAALELGQRVVETRLPARAEIRVGVVELVRVARQVVVLAIAVLVLDVNGIRVRIASYVVGLPL